jgi:hypothetical protein
MGELAYIIAQKAIELPCIELAVDGKVYKTYQEAEAVREQFPGDIRDYYGVFTVHCVTQQEVTFEAPF